MFKFNKKMLFSASEWKTKYNAVSPDRKGNLSCHLMFV